MVILRKLNRSGVAMIMVLCASTIILALTLALFYSSSVLLASANRKLLSERCYQLSKSFSEVVTNDLCTALPVPKADESAGSVLSYANNFLDGYYAEYDPENLQHTTYSYGVLASEGDDEYGSITVTLYKEESAEEEAEGEDALVISFEGVGDDYPLGVALAAAENRRFLDYSFSVLVTASLDDESYTYDTRYYRSVAYEVEYTAPNGQRIYGDDTGWQYGDGRVCGLIEPDGSNLTARYNIGRVINTQYRLERGDDL